MESQALQELNKKIFSDEKTKQQFISNPEGVISKFSLTEQEKKAVLNAHAKMGLVTSDSPQLEAAIKPTWIWSSPTP
jgi:hypothetical protein